MWRWAHDHAPTDATFYEGASIRKPLQEPPQELHGLLPYLLLSPRPEFPAQGCCNLPEPAEEAHALPTALL